MRWLAGIGIGLCLLGVAPAAAQKAPVRIAEIGLRGYYGSRPLRVRVEVSNPGAQQTTLTLHFFISEKPNYEEGRTDKFRLPVELAAGEIRMVEAPVPLHLRETPLVRVEARDPSDRVIGGDKQLLNQGWDGTLVAILCEQEPVCQEAQKQITFSGTMEEQVGKGKEYRFVAVQDLPDVWWAYAVADTVVVARDLKRLTPAQREALEKHARVGRLILLEQEAADPAFLAEYRTGPRDGRVVSIASGLLHRVDSLRSGELGRLFQGPRLRTAELGPLWRSADFSGLFEGTFRQWPAQSQNIFGVENHLIKRLANRLTFPTLWWLLGWLGAYILVVGLVNFTLLGRMRRREWGWVTVPALALAFAGGMYAASVASRPPTLSVDQVTLTWMDDRSPMAASEVTVRFTSPHRTTVGVSSPFEYVITDWPSRQQASVSKELFGGAAVEPPWDVRLGPTAEFVLPMLQWSYDQMGMRAVRRSPGTVHRTAPNRLRNDTGQDFREALFVDPESLYFLGPVAAGAEIDLNAARKEPLRDHIAKWTGSWGMYTRGGRREIDPEQIARETEEWNQILRGPFSLTELIRSWPDETQAIFHLQSGFFLGLSEEPAAEVSLRDAEYESHGQTVTVVKFGKQP